VASDRTPIHIVGAGPAGLAAAITIAQSDRQAIVHERAHDVGGRFHDDFQGLENWTTTRDVLDGLASFGIEIGFDHTPFRETVVFDPSGRPHRYGSPKPLYYLVRRGPGPGTLDASLKAQAHACGVEIRFDEARPHVPEGGIVAAGPRGADVIAVGYVFETDETDAAYGAVGDHLAPKGYAYLLLHGGRGTVAACLFDDFHNERTYLERTVGFFEDKVGLEMRNPRRFGGAGNFAVPQSAQRGRLLLAGEAAGFQDPLWGFGMRYAIVSGHLAARAVLNGDLALYDRSWQSRFGGLLRTGFVNRYLYAKLGDRGYAVLTRRLDRSTDVRARLHRYYGPSLASRLLYGWAHHSVCSRRAEAFCVMDGCDCTWCRCQHATPPSPVPA